MKIGFHAHTERREKGPRTRPRCDAKLRQRERREKKGENWGKENRIASRNKEDGIWKGEEEMCR